MSINTVFSSGMINVDDVEGLWLALPAVPNPDHSIIESNIKKIANAGRGHAVLRCDPIPKIGPDKLTLYVDEGNFLMMLGVRKADGHYRVRTITNKSMPRGFMNILGEPYGARAVTQDMDLVCAAFDEFARSGDVPWMD